jgi:hypothetical protein
VILEPSKLNRIAVDCKRHFDENYSMQQNMGKFINFLENANFIGKDYPVFKRPIHHVIYRTFVWVISRGISLKAKVKQID